MCSFLTKLENSLLRWLKLIASRFEVVEHCNDAMLSPYTNYTCMYVHYVTLFRDIKDIATTSPPMWQRTLKKNNAFWKKKCSKCVKFGFKSMDFEKTIKDFGCYKCPSAFLLIKLLTCIAFWKKYYINPDMVFVLNRFCFRQCKCFYVFINPVWCGTCISLLGTGRKQPKFQYNFQ